MNEIQTAPAVLNFDNFDIEAHIRIVLEKEVPLFIVKDVCQVLSHSNSRKAVEGLDPDELVSLKVTSGGQLRSMQAVTESGLYALIFKSRKPSALAFRKWVTSEVLPAIRTRGTYTLPAGVQRVQDALEAAIADLGAGRITLQEARAITRMHKQYMLGLRGEIQPTLRAAGGQLADTSVQEFFAECCEFQISAQASKDEVLEAYEGWCLARGIHAKSRPAFCRRLYELHPEIDVARYKNRKPEYHFVNLSLNQSK